MSFDEVSMTETELRSIFLTSAEYIASHRRSTKIGQEIVAQIPQRKEINYKNELMLYFYNEMLQYIVDEWQTVSVPASVDSDEEIVKSRDTSEVPTVQEATSTEKSDQTINSKTSSKLAAKLSKSQSLTKSDKASRIKSSLQNSLPVIEENENTEDKPEQSESSYNTMMSWFVRNDDEFAQILFKNGCTYVGPIKNKTMNGKGIFRWPDGASYEGEFCQGEMCGFGTLIYPERSYFKGQFCKGYLHGLGSFYPGNSTMIYSGNWKSGRKNGKGWLFYGPSNYYDGDWCEDRKDGIGLRKYPNHTIYNGAWQNGKIHGLGTIYFYNNDFYRGDWQHGVPHGYGEYTWNACLTKGLALNIENSYQGDWKDGQRQGLGVIQFGMEGSKLASHFNNNMKDGAGIIVCGNGITMNRNPLFDEDAPVHQTRFSSQRMPYNSKEIALSGTTLQFKLSKAKDYLHVKSQIEVNKLESMFPSIEPKCCPMEFPIHGTGTEIDLSYHISKLAADVNNGNSHMEDVKLPQSMWNLFVTSKESLMDDRETDIEQPLDCVFEEKKLHNNILKHYSLLENLYYKYANLTSDNRRCKPVMTRLFLWQMYRDFQVHKHNMSLISTDVLLHDYDFNGLESDHYPFEPIYFWQFLHSILCFIYHRYKSQIYFEERRGSGIFAHMLLDFIKDYIKPNQKAKFEGQCLFKYKNLLPINAIYQLYRGLGEPHTVRTLIRRCCVQKYKHPVCYLLDPTPEKSVVIKKGINAVCTGSNFVYLIDDESDIGEPKQEQPAYPIEADMFYKDLKVFRKLGIKKVIGCIAQICPMIKCDGYVVNINYQLTFLEFYEILIAFAEKLILMHNRKEKAKLKQSEISLKKQKSSQLTKKGLKNKKVAQV